MHPLSQFGIDMTNQTIAERLRHQCAALRTKPTPLADLIPLLQEAADALSAQQAAQPVATVKDGLTVAQPVAGEPVAWVDINDRVPDKGTDCLIWSQEPWEKAPSLKQDRWDEIHEAPVSFSSNTVYVGDGWVEDHTCVTHWMKAPAGPGTAAPAPVGLVPLTEAQLVECLVAAGCISTVRMSYDSGPYEITRTSINADRLARAIEAKLCEVNGIKAGKDVAT